MEDMKNVTSQKKRSREDSLQKEHTNISIIKTDQTSDPSLSYFTRAPVCATTLTTSHGYHSDKDVSSCNSKMSSNEVTSSLVNRESVNEGINSISITESPASRMHDTTGLSETNMTLITNTPVKSVEMVDNALKILPLFKVIDRSSKETENSIIKYQEQSNDTDILPHALLSSTCETRPSQKHKIIESSLLDQGSNKWNSEVNEGGEEVEMQSKYGIIRNETKAILPKTSSQSRPAMDTVNHICVPQSNLLEKIQPVVKANSTAPLMQKLSSQVEPVTLYEGNSHPSNALSTALLSKSNEAKKDLMHPIDPQDLKLAFDGPDLSRSAVRIVRDDCKGNSKESRNHACSSAEGKSEHVVKPSKKEKSAKREDDADGDSSSILFSGFIDRDRGRCVDGMFQNSEGVLQSESETSEHKEEITSKKRRVDVCTGRLLENVVSETTSSPMKAKEKIGHKSVISNDDKMHVNTITSNGEEIQAMRTSPDVIWSVRKNLAKRENVRWRAHQIAEDYISVASSITLPPTHLGPFGYSPTTGQYPIEQVTALGYLTSPIRRPLVIEKWSPYEIVTFEAALTLYGKVFHQVQKWIKTKTTKEIIEFYYIWKKTSHYNRWKSQYEGEISNDSSEEDERDSGKVKVGSTGTTSRSPISPFRRSRR